MRVVDRDPAVAAAGHLADRGVHPALDIAGRQGGGRRLGPLDPGEGRLVDPDPPLEPGELALPGREALGLAGRLLGIDRVRLDRGAAGGRRLAGRLEGRLGVGDLAFEPGARPPRPGPRRAAWPGRRSGWRPRRGPSRGSSETSRRASRPTRLSRRAVSSSILATWASSRASSAWAVARSGWLIPLSCWPKSPSASFSSFSSCDRPRRRRSIWMSPSCLARSTPIADAPPAAGEDDQDRGRSGRPRSPPPSRTVRPLTSTPADRQADPGQEREEADDRSAGARSARAP